MTQAQNLTNPHDSFFKAVFGDLERSRQFFLSYLPAKLANELNLDRLLIEKASFVDESLRQRHADLLFRTLLKSGIEAWIYLLFEHQSTPERDMPFRTLRYLVRIIEQHRQQYHEEHPYPVIVPVVLYHGTAPWNVPLRFSRMTEVQHDLGIHPLELEYILIDLSRYPDQLLMERLELELALSILRHIHDEGFLAHFRKILPLLLELRLRKTGLEYIETILRYIYYSRDKAEWNGLIEIMHQSDPIIEEIAMTTIAEHLIQQGEAAGIQKGRNEGMEEGKTTEAYDVLLELLEEQFGLLPSRIIDRLHKVQSHGLLRMLRRQRKACQSIDDFERLLERALQ